MARLDTQLHHQQDNNRALDMCINDFNTHANIHNMVTDLLNELDQRIMDDSSILENATGLCRHVGQVLLAKQLQDALDREISKLGAWAIYTGDSKGSVAKALRKNPSNLYNRTDVGRDIMKLLEAWEQLAKNESAHSISVKLHDGYVYELDRRSLE